ncbi:hypothetical protein WA026_016595 [Henosepilachna vigintioctopunctata]|uniref:Uncharacterized protein n=1 Tax=Henosepilachna vigintioctopunctata TaxID=420089 RepID=A0AAW1V8Y5_9CUCU
MDPRGGFSTQEGIEKFLSGMDFGLGEDQVIMECILDNVRAYDNVLIDIVHHDLIELEVPSIIVSNVLKWFMSRNVSMRIHGNHSKPILSQVVFLKRT